jgi:uncharacterized membrane protein YuzA (DUF378 family)
MTALFYLVMISEPIWANLETQISTTIGRMVTILNALLVGAVAWAGFLLAKGEGSAVARLIYCIMGLIVVNSASMILDFFKF